MKTGTSLNPYAASYIPLFKRTAGPDMDKQLSSTKELYQGNDAVQFGHVQQHHNSSQSHGQSAVAIQTNEFSKRMDYCSGEFFTSTSQYSNEKPEKSEFDEDMDIAYLQMTFPGISNESLQGVYLANKCDLDASVDMLSQLEMNPEESSDNLPDTLDIGDIPESSHVIASQEVKKTAIDDCAGSIGAATSGSSILLSTT